MIGGGWACCLWAGPGVPGWEHGGRRWGQEAGRGAGWSVAQLGRHFPLATRRARVPEGKRGERSWRRAGWLEEPCGNARCRCGLAGPAPVPLPRRVGALVPGGLAAPGVNPGWEGDPGSGLSFAHLFTALAAEQKTLALLHTPSPQMWRDLRYCRDFIFFKINF